MLALSTVAVLSLPLTGRVQAAKRTYRPAIFDTVAISKQHPNARAFFDELHRLGAARARAVARASDDRDVPMAPVARRLCRGICGPLPRRRSAGGEGLARRFRDRAPLRIGASPVLVVVPELLPRLAAFALARDIEPTVARELIVRHRLKAPPEADHRCPWPVRVRVLGGLSVELDGAPMPPARKESRRLLELLRLLAAHGTSPLAQERVADALWPEAEGDAARNSLDNAVHRLRKMLGGEDRVLLRHGTLALNRERCWVDVDALTRQIKRLANEPREQLASSLHESECLARADLLPDASEPIIVARRDELHRQADAAIRAASNRFARERPQDCR